MVATISDDIMNSSDNRALYSALLETENIDPKHASTVTKETLAQRKEEKKANCDSCNCPDIKETARIKESFEENLSSQKSSDASSMTVIPHSMVAANEEIVSAMKTKSSSQMFIAPITPLKRSPFADRTNSLIIDNGIENSFEKDKNVSSISKSLLKEKNRTLVSLLEEKDGKG